MKKIIASAALAVGLVATGFSQGTLTFANVSGTGGGVIDNLVLGTPLNGTAITLELFYGPAGSSLSTLLAGGTGIGDITFSYTTLSGANGGEFYDSSTVTTLRAGRNWFLRSHNQCRTGYCCMDR